ncbi:hypothetical protein GCM10023205_61380 [Yinghuangia aomiensis]|uniref:Uncharacterized protein n=1 Tax=Yinghuangia aomiensis TaxID=676205 RepID=A0ABP9HZG8_9ACTN
MAGEIAGNEGFIAKWGDDPNRGMRGLCALREERLVKLRSQLELFRRGLDPGRPRLFRGRVLLELRCAPKGHNLARVYPTSHNPVFVPSVACSRLIKLDADERRIRRDRDRVTRILDPVRETRDQWIEEFFDWQSYDAAVSSDLSNDELAKKQRDCTSYDISGLATLMESHRRWSVETVNGLVRPSWFLYCRCGLGAVATAEVMEALDSGARHLTV